MLIKFGVNVTKMTEEFTLRTDITQATERPNMGDKGLIRQNRLPYESLEWFRGNIDETNSEIPYGHVAVKLDIRKRRILEIYVFAPDLFIMPPLSVPGSTLINELPDDPFLPYANSRALDFKAVKALLEVPADEIQKRRLELIARCQQALGDIKGSRAPILNSGGSVKSWVMPERFGSGGYWKEGAFEVEIDKVGRLRRFSESHNYGMN